MAAALEEPCISAEVSPDVIRPFRSLMEEAYREAMSYPEACSNCHELIQGVAMGI